MPQWRDDDSNVVLLLSGGADSVTVAHHLAAVGNYSILGLFVDYGQVGVKQEWAASVKCAKACKFYGLRRLDMRGLKAILSSSLTGGDSGAHSYRVPARNTLLVSLAYGAALSFNARYVSFGAYSKLDKVEPQLMASNKDAGPSHIRKAVELLNDGSFDSELPDGLQVEPLMPFEFWTKRKMLEYGSKVLGIKYGRDTWSCYGSGRHHCGHCGACQSLKDVGFFPTK